MKNWSKYDEKLINYVFNYSSNNAMGVNILWYWESTTARWSSAIRFWQVWSGLRDVRWRAWTKCAGIRTRHCRTVERYPTGKNVVFGFRVNRMINVLFQVDNNRIDVSQRTASNDLTSTACRNYANDSKCIGLCFILLFILSSLLSNNLNINSPLLLKNYQSIR